MARKPRRDPRGLVMPSGRTIPRPQRARQKRASAPDVSDLPLPLAKAGGELMTLATAIRRCESCGRLDEPRAYGSGYPLASVFLLTDAPTPADVDAGVVFIETAEPLGKAFDALGIAPTDVYGASSMRCVPTGPDDLRVCSTHLLTEIEIVRPSVLVAFGPGAVAAIGGLHGRCGLEVSGEVVPGEVMRVRSDLMLLATEPLPEGVTTTDAKRRLWRDLQALRGAVR